MKIEQIVAALEAIGYAAACFTKDEIQAIGAKMQELIRGGYAIAEAIGAAVSATTPAKVLAGKGGGFGSVAVGKFQAEPREYVAPVAPVPEQKPLAWFERVPLEFRIRCGAKSLAALPKATMADVERVAAVWSLDQAAVFEVLTLAGQFRRGK